MENAVAIAAVAGPVYLLLGLSMLFYAKPWQKLMEQWEQNHLSLFTLMFVSFILGVFIVRSYNVWEWNLWLLVTLTGWCAVVKSVIYFLLPGSTVKALIKVGTNINLIYLGGLVGVVVGAALGYYVYFV